MQGLYLVTPDWDDTAALLAYTDAALDAGARLLQYRHKTAGDAQRREQAEALLALCRRHGVPFIVNDHVQLACDIGADGVHVGGTDASVAEARAQVGPGRIVGASCYGQLELAIDAARAGASYVAFGGFYPSRVKRYEVTTQPAILAEARAQVALPRIVIGGMTPANAAPLVAQGADMVAAISSVYGAADPAGAAAAAREFVRLFGHG
ncbi:thiamine-phosphate pyrophosphorylase [Pseudoduganella flava]|uniref:Thiamine-phosphate synthase n=1 Tax=Pseudoduganella flava TaxID=871742 RepID=A0A562Q348_9BURK|nr:thiamine phosphate synthase [Pseudoduganella flava]QGZ41195.1 thiamine phosphate synthase [Pseudoduganella flava]TWI51127.1 thiamine-phosphate pyrophosphorylase [Pseudoduganella flava]